MSKLERLYHLHHILSSRRTPISRQALMEQLECSQPTVYRAIADLRDHLGAPIEQDDETKGFYYDRHTVRPFELPGIWISPEELEALLSARVLLGNVQPGLLESELDTLRNRIGSLLAREGLDVSKLADKLHLVRQGGRAVDKRLFQDALSAVVSGNRLLIEYHSRGEDQTTEREISPQRLTLYRENWYLDAWCHLRKGLRSFALERIGPLQRTDRPARTLEQDQLDAHYSSAYGIFAGPANNTAILRFKPDAARWVADEVWHPEQEGRWLSDGHYELRLPFGNPTELQRDLLRYGPQVEVLEPESLRQRVAGAVRQTLALYEP